MIIKLHRHDLMKGNHIFYSQKQLILDNLYSALKQYSDLKLHSFKIYATIYDESRSEYVGHVLFHKELYRHIYLDEYNLDKIFIHMIIDLYSWVFKGISFNDLLKVSYVSEVYIDVYYIDETEYLSVKPKRNWFLGLNLKEV